MVDVVACDHADDLLDGLPAALGVQAELFPLLGRKRF